jgi:hypothetical protein
VDDVFNETAQEEYFNWMYEKVLLFKKVFGIYIQNYKANKWGGSPVVSGLMFPV